jgi:mRNA interferase RelE/StbE
VSGLRAYEVRLKDSAEKEFHHLPTAVAARVIKAMLSLESQPRRPGCKKLHSMSTYRFRVGDYRILYTINDAAHIVEVMAIVHRKDAYR